LDTIRRHGQQHVESGAAQFSFHQHNVPPDSNALLRAMDNPNPMPFFLNEMVG
jgi:hypothetical protein